ncbi:hypothetical protein AB0C18_26920 [Nonomuraea muscovyensis]|uniref:hypothetical protein n=1 Tax=Nonomuraea muscovyensis TaxID=1124761 RepID=UPI0033D0C705
MASSSAQSSGQSTGQSPAQSSGPPASSSHPSWAGPGDDPSTAQPAPVPAWQEARPSAGAWSNLSSPAPWPGADAQPGPAAAPADRGDPMDRTAAHGPAGRPTPPGAYGQGPEGRAPQYGAGPEGSPQGQYGAGPNGASPGQYGPNAAQQDPYHPGAAPQGQYGPNATHQDPYGPEATPQGRYDGTPLDDRAVPRGRAHPGDEHVAGDPGSAPPGDGQFPGDHARPGANLSRDPSDPDRPFVTAGQISGSRTPPPERQQELWNTVFGDNYEAMGEAEQLDEEQGRPIWIYALAGSVAIALVAALGWAFLAGPLAGEDTKATAATPTGKPSPSVSATRRATSIPPLPRYRGKAAPVIGVVQDAEAGVTVPRLGGTWQLDQRPTVQGTYGFDTRQYVQTGPGVYAQVMTGPLPERMASFHTSKTDLEPVIKAVVVNARKKFFPEDNKVRKIAQQPLKVGSASGQLIAYSLTSATQRATIVTAAVNTGNDVPAIVYMSIPATAKELLPDVNTVVRQLKVTANP